MRLHKHLLSILALIAATMLSLVPVATSAQGNELPRTSNEAAQGMTYARVVKRYGAAIRAAPSSDSMMYWMASCNDVYVVIGQAGGWYEILDRDDTTGWVGGARVSVGAAPAPVDCRGAVTFQAGGTAYATVASGCLSIRHQPSRTATYDACVPSGYRLEIMNGPIEVNGEDWFEVWSPSTGRGWSLADFLRPLPHSAPAASGTECRTSRSSAPCADTFAEASAMSHWASCLIQSRQVNEDHPAAALVNGPHTAQCILVGGPVRRWES
ncbi:MAG: SH3 domain-containing protein [Chloroflexota bacterium]